MASFGRLFTRAEAEALLPRLRVLLTELRDRATEIADLRAQLAAIPDAAKRNGHAREATALEERAAVAAQRANHLIETVQNMGVEIKDIATGLVDFRARREGRVVYLCWRLGEERIAFWHHIDAGFAGRQPLEEATE